MSLERTALRLAAVMALANGFASPFPTMAGPRVFDSRFDPLQIVDLADVMPIITVCTDDDHGSSLSDNNGGPPFAHTVTLGIDISIGMVGGDASEPQFAAMPQTEPELEAMLDLFERQIRAALVAPMSPWGQQFQAQVLRITSWSSVRYVEADSNVRLAARKLTASVALQTEDLIELAAVPPPSSPEIPAPLGPLLAAIVDDGGPFAEAAASLRDLLLDAGASAPITIPALERVRFIEANQADTNGGGTPKGPRQAGVAETPIPTP